MQPKDEEQPSAGPSKRPKTTKGKPVSPGAWLSKLPTNAFQAGDDASSVGGTPGSVDRKPHVDSKKPIKYPIEDLDLDPMSIHDGRILRRVNAELPTLPPKPTPSRELLVPPELFDTFIGTWNFLNVFSCVSPLFLTVPKTAADTYPTPWRKQDPLRPHQLHPRRLCRRTPPPHPRSSLHSPRRSPRMPHERHRYGPEPRPRHVWRLPGRPCAVTGGRGRGGQRRVAEGD